MSIHTVGKKHIMLLHTSMFREDCCFWGVQKEMVILNVCHTLESTATISPTPRIMSAR